jgi:hypothetical protein
MGKVEFLAAISTDLRAIKLAIAAVYVKPRW